MTITYSGKSKPSALAIARELDDIRLNRGSRGDVNWGRSWANTELNPDISKATNKRVMRELFKRNNVPMPRLVNRFDIRQEDYPLIGRPDYHTQGRGYWACYNANDVRRALRGTRRKRAATHFMEYVQADREYRVHIFKGKSIRISQKQYENGANRGSYTTIKPRDNVNHVRQAAKQAVEALDLDFGAVDVLATDNQAWVLEVNTAPGLGGSMPRLYADTFNRYLNGEWE